MFGKSAKRVAKALLVRLYNKNEDRQHTFQIPEGGSWKQGIAFDIKLFNSNNDVVRVIDFEAGFTVDITVVYKED